MDALDMLCSGSYIVANREVAIKFGPLEAIILGELAAEQRYWEKNGKLTEDGFFFSTQKNIEERTNISTKQQRRIVDEFVERGILETKVEGLPAKKYYKINMEVLYEILKNDNHSCDKPAQQDVTEVLTNKNKDNKNKDNKNNIFGKPNIQESGEVKENSLNTQPVTTQPEYTEKDNKQPAKKLNKLSIEDDFDGHAYTKADFLGSVGKKEKGKSLYAKCSAEIYNFTDDTELQVQLHNYLTLRLGMRDKPIRGVNQWIGMLNTLRDLAQSAHKQTIIVKQSIEHGWAAFYEKKYAKNDIQRVSCEYDEVHSKKVPGLRKSFVDELREQGKLEGGEELEEGMLV